MFYMQFVCSKIAYCHQVIIIVKCMVVVRLALPNKMMCLINLLVISSYFFCRGEGAPVCSGHRLFDFFWSSLVF